MQSQRVHIAAVGFLAYYIVGMWHELLGHGLALYLYGETFRAYVDVVAFDR